MVLIFVNLKMLILLIYSIIIYKLKTIFVHYFLYQRLPFATTNRLILNIDLIDYVFANVYYYLECNYFFVRLPLNSSPACPHIQCAL